MDPGREGLAYSGAHEIAKVLGEPLWVRQRGEPGVIARPLQGQYGHATATAYALPGLDREVWMGAEDVRLQALNLICMELPGERGPTR